jgi:hypothetical protein
MLGLLARVHLRHSLRYNFIAGNAKWEFRPIPVLEWLGWNAGRSKQEPKGLLSTLCGRSDFSALP